MITPIEGSRAKDTDSNNEAFQFTVPQLAYTGVKEHTYHPAHPKVTFWTQFFTNRFKKLSIFENFEAGNPGKSKEKATVVGVQWHRFSDLGPWFECQAAAMVTNNRMRHFIVQVAFEELGMRDENEIHPDLFWHSMQLAGLTESDKDRLSKGREVTNALNFLSQSLLECKSDSEILGMLLGLELPARENIETLFDSVAFSDEVEATLAESKFFKIHRCIEIEHIRLSVANFLRFCPTEEDQRKFSHGCDLGIKFWELFWSEVTTLIDREKGKTQ